MIRGELYMKITKSSLQNIIRKEFQILLEEMSLINEQELVDIGDIPLTSDQPTEIDFEKDTRQRKRRRSRWNTKCHPHKLKKGCKTAYVKSLQAKLKKLGYNLGKGGAKDDGVDGRFGNATHAAVIDFQKRNGSNPSGVGDSDFWSKLQGQRAKGPRKADPTVPKNLLRSPNKAQKKSRLVMEKVQVLQLRSQRKREKISPGTTE